MLRCTNGHDRCHLGPDPKCPYCENVYVTNPMTSRDILRLGRPAPKYVTPQNPLLYEDGHPKSLKVVEALLIETTIAYYKGQLSAVARSLGIGRSTLYRKLRDYNLRRLVNLKDG